MYQPSERTRLRLLCLLLILALGFLAFTAVNVFQSTSSFQQQYRAIKAGDVKTIRPWMTVPVISHVYHVPEQYLHHSLGMDNPNQLRKATLYEIASHKRQPVDKVIHTVQSAILTYRKQRPDGAAPLLAREAGLLLLLPEPGRT